MAAFELMKYIQSSTGKDFGLEDRPHSTENCYIEILERKLEELVRALSNFKFRTILRRFSDQTDHQEL
jgi:hypothetical protein